MQKLNFILIFVLSAIVFSGILPYPILSNHTNITEGDAFQINNINECEYSSNSNTKTKILTLDFDDIDVLLPCGTEFELLDIESEQIFTFIRTGGENHADIEPLSTMEFETLSEGVDFSWQRRPAIVKLNESAFLPASWVAYPHGYSKTNACHGHFCLHFLHSETDGTEEEDFQHQKAVKKALSTAENYIEFFD